MRDGNDGMTRRTVLKRGTIATGALIVGGTGSAAADIGDGRVGHYTLNNLHYNPAKEKEKDGLVFDASPEKNHGEWIGDTEYSDVVVSGQVGNAYQFDGDGDYVAVEDDGSLDLTSQVTVSAWGYLTGDPTTKQAIISKDWDLENALPYVIHIGTNHAGDDLSFGFYDGNWYEVTIGQQAPQEEWFHVAGVFDNGTLRINFNGGEIVNETTVSRESLPSNDQPLLIGRRTGSGETRQDFTGKIDEARVYDRVLSSTEISELAAMGTE